MSLAGPAIDGHRLDANLDTYTGTIPLLNRTQDITEARALLSPVLLGTVFVGISSQLLECLT